MVTPLFSNFMRNESLSPNVYSKEHSAYIIEEQILSLHTVFNSPRSINLILT